MGLTTTNLVGDDPAGILIEEIVVVVDHGLGHSTLDGEDIVHRCEFGSIDDDHLVFRMAETAIYGKIRVEVNFTKLVEVFEVFVEVPRIGTGPVHVHVDRAGFDEVSRGGEGLTQTFPSAHETLVGAMG